MEASRALEEVARACATPVTPAGAGQLADGFCASRCEHGQRHQADLDARGHDVSDYALACFGGAGGQHACVVADALDIRRWSSTRWPGCSAPTAWASPTRACCASEAWRRPSRRRTARPSAALAELEAAALDELAAAGIAAAVTRVERRVHLKYAGTDISLPVPARRARRWRETFLARTARATGS